MSTFSNQHLFLPPDSIWNAFRCSSRQHLILTGSRGSGKTTLLSRLSPPLPGITTRAVPGEAVYLRDNQTGNSVPIGRFDASLPGTKNRMRTLPEGFETLGISVLERCMKSESEWISIDEIGYLESGCPRYCEAILQLLERKHVIAAVRRQDLPFLTELCRRKDVFLVDLDAPFGNLGCVIMASGLGTRFGGNKLTADFDGVPLIRRVLDATEHIFHRRVVVTRHPEVSGLCKELTIPVIEHDLPLRSDTVRLGLQAIGEDVDGCLFCPGDQPLLRRETVISLALSAANEADAVWRPACRSVPGSPVIFPKRTFAQLCSLPAGRGGGYIAKQHPEWVRFLPVDDPLELADVDTREDLERLIRHAGAPLRIQESVCGRQTPGKEPNCPEPANDTIT